METGHYLAAQILLDAALAKSVDQCGNLEAGILLEPSKDWKAQTLFEEKAKCILLTWDQLSSEKDVEEEEDKKTAIVDQWGFQTPSSEAIIFSPGLSDGEVVFVRLSGISKPIEVRVKWRDDSFLGSRFLG